MPHVVNGRHSTAGELKDNGHRCSPVQPVPTHMHTVIIFW